MSYVAREAAQTVMQILSEDKNRYWSQTELISEMKKRTCNSGSSYRVVLNALVSTGKIGGHVGYSKMAVPCRIHWVDQTQTGKAESSSSDIKRDLQTQENLDKALKAIASATEKDIKQTKQIEELEAKVAAKPKDRVIAVSLKRDKKETKRTEGLFHEKFERLLQLCQARKNIFLYGPTGCGKSHVCGQLAEALDLPFYFISCTTGMSEGQVAGRLTPSQPDPVAMKAHYDELVKEKVPTAAASTLAAAMAQGFSFVIAEFIKAYETGGIFLLDEMDAADPNVLLIINAALANGKMAVPNRPANPYAKRHEDFICIGAANTVGTGSDRLYPGRNKLDGSTLDRFLVGKVHMDYDRKVEALLCPDEELRTKLELYRQGINAHRLERAMSTRFMIDAHEMMHNDLGFSWTQDEIDQAFFEGWREDEINKVKQYVSQNS